MKVVKMKIKIVEKWKEEFTYYVKVRDEKTGIEAIGSSIGFGYDGAFREAVKELERLVREYGEE